MYVKQLFESEIIALKKRFESIKELQVKGICPSCYNCRTGEIFPDEGLIFYEVEKVRCQFEKYPRATGHSIIVSKEHYEDISEMPLDLGTYILKIADAIIKLHKEIYRCRKSIYV